MYAATAIHRLDRLTSGLTLLTADTLEARRLQALMKSGQLRKTYLARCHGHLLQYAPSLAPPRAAPLRC